jgi:hypothetical protein
MMEHSSQLFLHSGRLQARGISSLVSTGADDKAGSRAMKSRICRADQRMPSVDGGWFHQRYE